MVQGLDAALERKKRERPPIEPILACSQPPKGRSRWTLELLADKLVELSIVESISYRTVQKV